MRPKARIHMSEIQNTAANAAVDFSKLKPVKGDMKLKTFTVVGADLTEKQKKAGYYLQINEGDRIDGLFNGMSTNTQGDYPSEEISISSLDGQEIIVKANASLKRQMAEIEVGSPVSLIYKGKSILKKGPGKNKEVKNWLVMA